MSLSFGITQDNLETNFYGFAGTWLALFTLANASTLVDRKSLSVTNVLGLAYYGAMLALYQSFSSNTTAFMRMFNSTFVLFVPLWLFVNSVIYIAAEYYSFTKVVGDVSGIQKIIVWITALTSEYAYFKFAWEMRTAFNEKKDLL